MFTMLPLQAQAHSQPTIYTTYAPSPLSSSPLRASPSSPSSSPLSTRDANLPDSMMSSPSKPPQSHSRPAASSMTQSSPARTLLPSPPPSRRQSSYSKRTTKVNPLIHGRGTGDEGRETRRKLFLKGVREASEEKRWRNRGGDDEIMRSIWVAEERRVKERKRREALGLDVPVEAVEEVLDGTPDELMAAEFAASQELELEGFLGASTAQDIPDGMDTEAFEWPIYLPSTPTLAPLYSESMYGSDDDEYDNIFLDVIQQETIVSSQQQQPVEASEDTDFMDMS